MKGIQTALDVASLVAFLWEVEAEADVKTYANEFIGSGVNVFTFVREFVDKRKAVVAIQSQAKAPVNVEDIDDFQVSKKTSKKKTKFSKAPASLLSFKTEGPVDNDDDE